MNPQVTLDFGVMFCPHHLEPFRAEWPRFSTFALLGMFNAAVRDERIIKESGGDTKELTSIFGRHRPICCYLNETHPGVAEEVVNLALMGLVWGMPPDFIKPA